jgi:hypothetical protein
MKMKALLVLFALLTTGVSVALAHLRSLTTTLTAYPPPSTESSKGLKRRLALVAAKRRLAVGAATLAAVVGVAASSATASREVTSRLQATDYNWYPGHYALSNADTSLRKQKFLDDPLITPFTGVQFRYWWSKSELSAGNYSAGFTALDADLARVAAKGKKLLVMLMYKTFDGTSAVPADLRTGPGPWCYGPYCGELKTASSSVAMLWNAAVEARLNAWIAAMAAHLAQSPYIASVAGIVFNETSLGTTSKTVLASAGYDPYAYIRALEDNLLAVTVAAPRLIAILYFEGGFVSMDGKSVEAGKRLGDWMLLHPRTGLGTADLMPKDPKGPNFPCANIAYQSHIACAGAVGKNDYSTAVTDSFQQSFDYGTKPVPNGLRASFLTFLYGVTASSTNAFGFADVSRAIPTHPIPNVDRPW